MNDTPRLKLIEIVARHGKTVIDNPSQLQGLLLDHCGEYRREIRALMDAVSERIPQDLGTASGSMPAIVLIASSTRHLLDKLPMAEDMAYWAVETWAIALGVIPLPSTLTPAEPHAVLINPFQPPAAPVVVPKSTPVPAKTSLPSSPTQTCGHCQTVVPAVTLFCPICASAIAPKTCFHCGFGQVPDAARCCPKCGKPV
jgi:hypothetical protein